MMTYDDPNDSMNPIRGLVLGILISLPFWALFLVGIQALF